MLDPLPLFSRLTLGTVQLGMPYGVANRTGQPDLSEARDMVRLALDHGVNTFDTAAAYGESELVLGRVIADLGVAPQVTVITKIPGLSAEAARSPAVAASEIAKSLEQSQARLGLATLPLVLFHVETDHVHLPLLEPWLKRGQVRAAGVSCGFVSELAVQIANRPEVSAIQIPINLLDRRHRDGGTVATAAAQGVKIFLRSVFLQGLLLMPESDIPAHLRSVITVRQPLEALARQAGMSLQELGLRHALSLSGVSSVLVGVERAAQLRENLAIYQRGPLPAELFAAVEAASQSVSQQIPEFLMTPSRWQAAAQGGR